MAQSDYTALSSGCQVVRTSRSDVSYLLDKGTRPRMLQQTRSVQTLGPM